MDDHMTGDSKERVKNKIEMEIPNKITPVYSNLDVEELIGKKKKPAKMKKKRSNLDSEDSFMGIISKYMSV